MSTSHNEIPHVTVFITTYNNARFIAKSVQSVLNQSFENFELIIIDDGSNDNTASILGQLKDDRIRIITNKENKGIVYSRNLALKHAKGKFLAVLDGDDIALPDRLSIQLKEFSLRPQLGLLGGQAYIIDEFGKRYGSIPERVVGPDEAKTQLFFDNPFTHSSVMMRMDIFRRVNGYPNMRIPVVEDLALYINISNFCEVDNVPDYLVEYRRHSDNVTRSRYKDVYNMLTELRGRHLKDFGIANYLDKAKMLTYYRMPNTLGLDMYRNLFCELIEVNQRLTVYKIEVFNKNIYQMWLEILMTRAPNRALIGLFSLPGFKINYFTKKQMLKVLLKSLLPPQRRLKVVKILGGLGNQMFQYAFFLALKDQGHNVKVDVDDFSRYELHNGLELETVFKISLNKVKESERRLLIKSKRDSLFLRLQRRLMKSRKSFVQEQPLFSFQPHHLTNPGFAYYWGYWQHEDYFSHIKTTVREVFNFPPLKGKRNKILYQTIKNSNSVGVHVRRGDYLKDPLLGNVCDLDYFTRGVNYLRSQIANPVFFFFSDDSEWCKNHFDGLNVHFIDWNLGGNSYIDMQLMSNCQHQVISNSSFSWWAAWLNSNEEKIVIAPKRWISDSSIDTTGLTMNFIQM
ncbi:alpha-1,2-fucosyltransferase [Sphingobacterium corticis]|uniref:Alpha-1,2-fucosyltransferase n=1 Tax=Sphingobacterium corticis TaxID=1812823 RepID=A0ABW5NHG3_9SPHI